MAEGFHFLRPDWLYALLPLPLVAWGLIRRETDASSWRGVIEPHLLPHLVSGGDRGSRLPLALLAAGWMTAVLALADPAWNRQPEPLLKSRAARVIVLDLSRSMSTPDLAPSRLAWARFKVADVLQRSRDGQTGLVAYAGDAFVVSPLTEDGATVAALLGALEPGIMPVQGSRADLGLLKAEELLTGAGADRGEVLLMTDEADESALDAARALRDRGHRVSVLGIGTEEGAPVPDGHGGFVATAESKPVVAALEQGPLRDLARAGGGRYALVSAGSQDLEQLFPALTGRLDTRSEETETGGERWIERGPWIALLLLPLGALAFRRGWLVTVALLSLGGLGNPGPVQAIGWDDLWQRRDQQAAAALREGDNARAAEVARDPLRKGAALYRTGRLEEAAESFGRDESADGHYNRGNALANLGRYQEAIAAYEKALARQPGMDDAAHNKAQVESLLDRLKNQDQEGRSTQNPEGNDDPEQQGTKSASEASGGKAPSDAPEEGSGQETAASQDQSRPQEPEKNPDAGDENQRDPGASRAQDRGGAGQPPARSETASEGDSETAQPTPGPVEGASDTDPLDAEERQAVEQWLRRIPDDPGGLLRRKFLHQYRERAAVSTAPAGKRW